MIRLDLVVRLERGGPSIPEAIDRASDAIMDALVARSDIANPDVAVSMSEPSVEVWLDVPTDDVMIAVELGTRALAKAFAEATRVAEEWPLGNVAGLRAELVPA